MTGLVCAVEVEGEEIAEALLRRRRSVRGGLTFWRGVLRGKPVALVFSGVGKTNAAHAATLLAERFRPRLVVNFGVGGAYRGSGLSVGDIAIADKEIYGDEGVITPGGFLDMRGMGLPLLQCPGGGEGGLFNEIPLEGALVKKALDILRGLSFSPRRGAFVTLSTVTGTASRAEDLVKRYGALCENMEGAAVAHVCRLYGIPFLEMRGMSNMVEERDRGRWRLGEAARECQKALMALMGRRDELTTTGANALI